MSAARTKETKSTKAKSTPKKSIASKSGKAASKKATPAKPSASKPVKSANSVPAYYDSYNPATGEKLGRVDCIPIQEMPKNFEQARNAQKIWAEMDFRQRRSHIFRIRDYMVAHTEEIVGTGSVEFEISIFKASKRLFGLRKVLSMSILCLKFLKQRLEFDG